MHRVAHVELIKDLGDIDFEVHVIAPGELMGVDFMIEKPKITLPGQQNKGTLVPILFFNCDPQSEDTVVRKYTIVPVMAMVACQEGIDFVPCGVYRAPGGNMLALYERIQHETR